MTDDSADHESVSHGVTAGGGGAANAVQDHANPVQGVFDNVSPSPGSAKPDPILVCDDVTKRFGGLVAVEVDHLEIQRGAITALIGPNGAGKTTFFNLLTSFDKMNSGTVVLDGKDISDVPSYRLANQGMVRTFQLTKVLSRMSVLDNMKLGATHQEGEHFWKALLPVWHGQEKRVEARADALLDRFNLMHMRDEYAGTMSGGQRKLVEMARALMTEPRLVMLDEPMAGVNPALTQSLLGHVKGLRAEGRTVIFVEHDMDVVQDISDWVVVMAEGRIIAEGTPDDISADRAVIDAYLGAHRDSDLSEWDDDEPPAVEASDDTEAIEEEGAGVSDARSLLIHVDNIRAGYVPGVDILNGCSLELYDGELIGIIGPNGAGKSTLLKALFGLLDVREGQVLYEGDDISAASAHELVDRGIGYVPQRDNVFPALTVEENLEMGAFLRPKTFKRGLDLVCEMFPRLAERLSQRAGSLSGGERQMLAMSRALMMDPKVILLDEPSAGLSPVLQDQVFIRTREINRAGVSVVMVEQNARRCLQICDRGYVLDQGTNAYSDTGRNLLHDPKVIELYLGTLAKAD